MQPRSKKLRRNVEHEKRNKYEILGIRLIIENIILGELSQLSATKYMLYILECETVCSHFLCEVSLLIVRCLEINKASADRLTNADRIARCGSYYIKEIVIVFDLS
jgi:hypothetical protein